MIQTNTITFDNNPVALNVDSDGIVMLFSKAVATSAGTTPFVLGTAYLLTKLDDLVTKLGITSAYDATNHVSLFQQINEFYDGGVNDGLKIWLVGVAKATDFDDYVITEPFKELLRITSQADPANRAKYIAFAPVTEQVSRLSTDIAKADAFPAEVFATLTALKDVETALTEEGFPFGYMIGGNGMASNLSESDLPSLVLKDTPKGSVLVTGLQDNGVASVGNALSRIALTRIGRGYGAVEDGSIASTAYLTNGCPVIIAAGGTLIVGITYTVSVGAITYNSVVYNVGDSFTCVTGFTTFTTSASGVVSVVSSDVALFPLKDSSGSPYYELGSKQYVFLRRRKNQEGYFYHDGATATSSTKPVSDIPIVRVLNHFITEAQNFIETTMQADVPIDVVTGLVTTPYVEEKQATFYENSIKPKTDKELGTGDISDGKLTLSGVLQGSKVLWTYTLEIVPRGIVNGSTGVIRFVSTLTQ